MSLCSSCNVAISRKPAVTCEGYCKRQFHTACVGVSAEVSKLLPTCPGLTWKCEDCFNATGQNLYNSLNSKIETLFTDLNQLFSNVKVDFKEIAEENLKAINPKPVVETYSQKLKQASILIKPNDDNQQNSATKSEIMQKINPLDNNIQINAVRHISNGGVIVGCGNYEEAAKFKELAEKELTNYVVKDIKNVQPRVRVVGLNDKLDEETILQYVLLQNKHILTEHSVVKVIEVKPLKKKENVFQAVLQTDIRTYNKLLQEGHMMIGLDSCIVYDAITVLRCFSCNGFNHDSRVCSKKHDPICPRCAKNHSIKDCKSSVLKCINCTNLKNKEGVDICHAAWDYDKCQSYKNVLGKLKFDVLGTK